MKNIPNFQNIVMLIIFYFVQGLYSLPSLVITEVAPSELSSNDWIEIFVLSSGNYSGYQLWSGYPSKMLKELPPRNYSYQDFIVITLNSSAGDSTEKDFNNCWIFYSTNTTGIYSSEGFIYLKDNSGNWIDIVAYSNRDGTMSSDSRNAYNEMKQKNMWLDGPTTANGTNDVEVQNSLVNWKEGDAGKSILRKRDTKGLPLDTNSLSDWDFSKTQSKGYGYKEIVPSMSEKIVEVDKNYNPFSPEDIQKNFAVINFNVQDAESKKTVRIFNILGDEIIKLIDNDVPFSSNISLYDGVPSGAIIWDGKDKNGVCVPCGIYIVYVEGYNTSTNVRRIGKDIVVVGRKF